MWKRWGASEVCAEVQEARVGGRELPAASASPSPRLARRRHPRVIVTRACLLHTEEGESMEGKRRGRRRRELCGPKENFRQYAILDAGSSAATSRRRPPQGSRIRSSVWGSSACSTRSPETTTRRAEPGGEAELEFDAGRGAVEWAVPDELHRVLAGGEGTTQ